MNQPMDRRAFLKRIGSGTAATLLGGCHSPESRQPGEPGLQVIDTHTHFYDPTRPQGVPWPPRGDALLYRTVLPENYLALPTPTPVHGTVVVEASPWVEDNQWILDLADREPFIVGFVGNLPVGTPEFPRLLQRFARHQLFRGIRIRGLDLSQALANPAVRSDLRGLADANLSLDLVGGGEILGPTRRLAQQISALRIVIDHLAGVRTDGTKPPDDWVQPMALAAAQPNVYAKISGLVEGSGRSHGTAPKDLGFYRPVLDVMWDLFGPDRLIYGSNWPVSERFASLGTVQGVAQAYLRERGSEAEAKVFSENARKVYGWIKREKRTPGSRAG